MMSTAAVFVVGGCIAFAPAVIAGFVMMVTGSIGNFTDDTPEERHKKNRNLTIIVLCLVIPLLICAVGSSFFFISHLLDKRLASTSNKRAIDKKNIDEDLQEIDVQLKLLEQGQASMIAGNRVMLFPARHTSLSAAVAAAPADVVEFANSLRSASSDAVNERSSLLRSSN